NDACFIVRDHNGQALAYVYYEEEPGRRSAAKLLSKDEARRIAANIAKTTRLHASAVRSCRGDRDSYVLCSVPSRSLSVARPNNLEKESDPSSGTAKFVAPLVDAITLR